MRAVGMRAVGMMTVGVRAVWVRADFWSHGKEEHCCKPTLTIVINRAVMSIPFVM
jgi:hypothetical protein